MTDDKFERFGKYLILDHLVDGGMAKICRARFLGEQANKIVAIKMIQPQFSKDPSFVQMFQDELKVTFGLHHPNIVQMTDYGSVEGRLYSAMEYVDGATLKEFLDRLREKNFVFPVGITTYIISQVCQALQYAHTFTDKLSGKPFNIIHRDISPHNIMLTYDGSVKVIDFGIAKADSNTEHTQAGTIKGKLSYLAPEYLEGLELDHRYDQFAVGLTLWELLCSRKLFTAQNDLAVLKLIQNCKIPRPSSVNPNVPKELDEIVLKSLSKDRNNRYENMDQFNRALVRFLYSQYPDFNATDLSFFAQQLFKEEIIEDKNKFVEYGKIDITSYLQDMGRENQTPVAQKAKSTSDVDLNLRSTGDTVKLRFNMEEPPPSSHVQRKKIVKSAAEVASDKRQREQNRDDETRRSNHTLRWLAVAGLATFIFYKTGNIEFFTPSSLLESVVSTFSKEKSPVRSVAKVEGKMIDPIAQKLGTITFSNYDSAYTIRLNGKVQELNGINLEVELNKELEFTVSKEGSQTFKFEKFELDEDDRFRQITIPALEELQMGTLTSSRNFEDSVLVIPELGMRVPLPVEGLSLPAGTYNARIESTELGVSSQRTFTILKNKKFELKYP